MHVYEMDLRVINNISDNTVTSDNWRCVMYEYFHFNRVSSVNVTIICSNNQSSFGLSSAKISFLKRSHNFQRPASSH